MSTRQCTLSGCLVRPLCPCNPPSLADALADDGIDYGTIGVQGHTWYSGGVDLYFRILWEGYDDPSEWRPDSLHGNGHLLDYVSTLLPPEQARVASELDHQRIDLPDDSDDAGDTSLLTSWTQGEQRRGGSTPSVLIPYY